MRTVSNPFEDAQNKLLGFILRFRRDVAPWLDPQMAECLAMYWFIVTIKWSIDDASAEKFGNSLVPRLFDESWSSWCNNETGFTPRFQKICQAAQVGEQFAMAIGAGSASLQDQVMLCFMNIAKSALAVAGRDDTDALNVTGVMLQLEKLHAKAWPIIQTVARQRYPDPQRNRCHFRRLA